jgi:hypothetical protein
MLVAVVVLKITVRQIQMLKAMVAWAVAETLVQLVLLAQLILAVVAVVQEPAVTTAATAVREL